ncbi:carbohydrate ABC transporter permease [Candidatus Xianfuyuplasma coldseepsis]|uniref:Carbohydrate ABC transporter permease n=1 Tax=Candidatus Xianfuyuplasma coldseepsis TaxID=2782163 RepID=A0A7L7KQ38_9MOLU|nr:carbohydrate ABC transporter permease [Xianfuyuplasma coldseepsis]QMS84797.1 carbohydrate ABC transporter permease [Xianfuyuplasma coldseepsis]
MTDEKRNTLIYSVIGFILMIAFFFPFFIVLINSAKDSFTITQDPLSLPTDMGQLFENIKIIVQHDGIKYFSSFFNSLLITTLSLITIGISSAMAAWVLVRTKSKLSYIIFLFFLSGMVIPFQVVMLPLVSLLEILREITTIPFKDTYWGVILAYIGFGAPLSVFLFHGFIKSIPTDIEEAAIIDGCSKSQVFFRVVLPILKPIFVTMLVLNGMWIWNDYLLPSLVIGIGGDVQTLPLAVANLAGTYVKQWDLILTSVLMAALPVIILFLFAQKHIIKGMTSGAIK